MGWLAGVVGGVPLALAALYLAAYFGLNSSAANAWLERALLKQAPRGAITVARAQWGPAPAWVWLAEPRGHGPDDRETLQAHAVGLRLALDAAHPFKPRPTALVATRARVLDKDGEVAIHAAHVQAKLPPGARHEVRLTTVRVDGFLVDLAWDPRGRSSVRRSFRLRKPRAPKPPPSGPKQPPLPPPKRVPVVHLDDIVLRHGAVRLDWPKQALSFTDVQALGAVTVGGPDGLAITAQARAGGSTLTEGLEPKARKIAVTRVAIDGFRWRGEGFESERATLMGAPGAAPLADLAVSLGPGAAQDGGHGGHGGADDSALRIRGEVNLAGDTLEAWLGKLRLPAGVRVHALDLTAGGKTLRATARLDAPVVRGGGWSARGVRARAEGAVTLGAVIPTGTVSLHDVDAETVRGPRGVSLEAPHLDRVEARVAADATIAARGLRAATLTLPRGRVRALAGRADLTLGLTGGRYEATLKTAAGDISLRGTLSLELLLGKRLRFRGAARLRDLGGALAATTLETVHADLPDPPAPVGDGAGLRPPLSGELRFGGTLAPARGARATFGLAPHATWGSGWLEDAAGRRLVREDGEGPWTLTGTPQ